MKSLALGPLLLVPLLAGCSQPDAPPGLPQAYAFEQATYVVEYVSEGKSSVIASLNVTQTFEPATVVQAIVFPGGNLSPVIARLDRFTGQLLQFDTTFGTTFPISVQASGPILGLGMNTRDKPDAPVVFALHGLQWAAASNHWRTGTLPNGPWQVDVEHGATGYRLEATAPCDNGCSPNKPTWNTTMEIDDGFLPRLVVLGADTVIFQIQLTRKTHVAREPIHLAASPIPVDVRRAPEDNSCLPLPCEGGGLPAEFAFAAAFSDLQQTSQWQEWQASHESWLSIFGISRANAATITAAGDVPLPGNHWGFVFYSPQGDEGYFFLRSYDVGPVTTPRVLLSNGVQPMGEYYREHADENQSFTSAAIPANAMLGTELFRTRPIPLEYALTLVVQPKLEDPSDVFNQRWLLVNRDTHAVAMASAYDGRLLGIYPGGLPQWAL